MISILSVLSVLSVGTASAALREYRVEFQPSASPDAVGYTLHVGTASGTYATEFDLGNPPPTGGTIIYGVDFEDSVDLFVALRGYDGAGVPSDYSNEIRVTAIVPPPSDESEPPATDGGDGGDPDTAPDPSTDGGGSDGGSSEEPGASTPPSDSGDGGDSSGGEEPSAGGDDSGDRPAPVDSNVIGLMAAAADRIESLSIDGTNDTLTQDSMARLNDLRPARCDLDGDGDRDLVMGYGSESSATLAVFYMEHTLIKSTDVILAATEKYRLADGMTYPSCGDLDGDGLAEIVVGFGPEMEGRIQIFDDVETDFAPMNSARLDADGWLTIVTRGSEYVPLFPAVGDIDGDGVDEVVVGSGDGSRMGIVVLDDHTKDFAPHPSVASSRGVIKPMPATWFSKHRRVMRRPAVGDVDGDGWDEIVVSFGKGSGGQIMILDDARGGYDRNGSPTNVTIAAGRDTFRARDGETNVALGDVDLDGRAEIVVGFSGRDRDELQLFDDAAVGSKPMGPVGGFIAGPSSDAALVPSPVE